MAADKMAKNDQKCWSQPGFEPGVFERETKSDNFLPKALLLSYWSFLLNGAEFTQNHFKTIYQPKQIYI